MIVRAPGRVNLIGEHTDYSEGLCLPMAIDRECRVTATPTTRPRVRAVSHQLEGVVEVDVPAAGPLGAVAGPRWGRFVAGAVTAVRDAGHAVGGMDLEIHSTVPAGAGLSSSSALSIALVLALLPVDARVRRDHVAVARLALAAEVAATGVPGGLLDQMASLGGVADHALLLDCRTLTVEAVPLPAGLAVLVVHSGVSRELAGSEYAERRAACEAAARRIGVPTLRDATAEQVADDPIARHVVSENARVLACCEALRAGDLDELGRLLLAGHASLRDDFRVSIPELDVLVETFVANGAYGARLTGAGFGGCVVGLAPAPTARACLAGTLRTYAERTDRFPTGFRVHAVAGAGPVDG
ncbi:MAG: galactokinase [Acidimicrobiia bacterium]